MAELRPVRHQSGLTHSGSLKVQGASDWMKMEVRISDKMSIRRAEDLGSGQ